MESGLCASQDMQKSRPTQLTISKVSNGYIISGFGINQKISNTLSEALELVRKELE